MTCRSSISDSEECLQKIPKSAAVMEQVRGGQTQMIKARCHCYTSATAKLQENKTILGQWFEYDNMTLNTDIDSGATGRQR